METFPPELICITGALVPFLRTNPPVRFAGLPRKVPENNPSVGAFNPPALVNPAKLPVDTLRHISPEGSPVEYTPFRYKFPEASTPHS